MDSLLTAAARLLAAGDPLGGLKRVALRKDAPALALRGIAMAQLGDYASARELLRRAAGRFGAGEPLAQARCQVAQAEIALASRDLRRATAGLDVAVRTLEAHGDLANAVHARLIGACFHLLVGEFEAAEAMLRSVDTADPSLPLALVARAELTRAELALRRIRASDASAALDRARAAAKPPEFPRSSPRSTASTTRGPRPRRDSFAAGWWSGCGWPTWRRCSRRAKWSSTRVAARCGAAGEVFD